MRATAVLCSTLALAFVPGAAAGVIPQHGIFVVGKTLAGVGLGYTQVQVKQRWGSYYTLCTAKPLCTTAEPVWLFIPPIGEPLGVGVRFLNDKAVDVFTLGTPGVNPLSTGGLGGWRTTQGLSMFDSVSSIYSLYPAATISTQCVLYDALSERSGGVTSSFYISSGTVYGFALSAPHQPICA